MSPFTGFVTFVNIFAVAASVTFYMHFHCLCLRLPHCLRHLRGRRSMSLSLFTVAVSASVSTHLSLPPLSSSLSVSVPISVAVHCHCHRCCRCVTALIVSDPTTALSLSSLSDDRFHSVLPFALTICPYGPHLDYSRHAQSRYASLPSASPKRPLSQSFHLRHTILS